MSPQQTIDTFLTHPDEIERLYGWVFENIHPYIKGRTLEINSGQGSFASLLIEQNLPVHLSEPDKAIREKLREKFQGYASIKAVHNIDILRTQDFGQIYSSMTGVFSTILAFNIPEEISSLQQVVENLKLLLRKGGHLIASIPSQTEIFPGSNPDLYGLKQIDQKPILQLLGDFQLLKMRYFTIEKVNTFPMLKQTGLSVLTIARKNRPIIPST